MLSSFASTIEALNDYECASRALRHLVNIRQRSLQVVWVVYEQLRRAGLGRLIYLVCRRFSKHATQARPGQDGVYGSPVAVPKVIPCIYLAWYVWRVCLSAH